MMDGQAPSIARAPEKRGHTVYMGLNPTAKKKEAAPLRRLLGRDLTVSTDDKALESRLSTDVGVLDWVLRSLPPARRSPLQVLRIYALLCSFGASTRDSIAPVIVAFDKAQRGAISLERLVLSGHSNGVSLWGDASRDKRGGGRFVLDKDLQRLVGVFPKAAAQVEDVMFSACFSTVAIKQVRAAFPNVQTVWGYEEFSPKAGKGSLGHIRRWERATRGGRKLRRIDGRGSASLWNAGGPNGTFVRRDPAAVDHRLLFGAVNSEMDGFRAAYEGRAPIRRDYLARIYGDVQRVLAHPRVPASDKAKLGAYRDALLRLRYWHNVAPRFYREHAPVIDGGYRAIGRDPQRFAGLTRKQLASDMSAIETQGSAEATAAHTALKPLWSLRDTAAIPDTWI